MLLPPITVSRVPTSLSPISLPPGAEHHSLLTPVLSPISLNFGDKNHPSHAKNPTSPSNSKLPEESDECHPHANHQRSATDSRRPAPALGPLRVPSPVSLKSGNKTLPSPSGRSQDENHPHIHLQPSPSDFKCPSPVLYTHSIPSPISMNLCNKNLPAPSKSRSQDEDHPHAYRRPSKSDSRCPCPALNTLANHGYLPRDGKNISVPKLLEALMNPETYNLSSELADVLAKGGAVLADTTHSRLLCEMFTSGTCLSLHEIGVHGGIEHDASMVHKNVAKGKKFAPVEADPDLLNAFLGERPTISLEDVASRRVKLERVSPLTVFFAEIARGEWALVLDVFGRAHGGQIPAGLLRVWLEENRFPQGWRPEHKQGLWETSQTSKKIRHAMSRIRDERAGTTAEDDAETERMLCSEPEGENHQH